jgi:hypothetical protein
MGFERVGESGGSPCLLRRGRMTASEKIRLIRLRLVCFGLVTLCHRYPSPPSKLISIGVFLAPEQGANTICSSRFRSQGIFFREIR